MQARCKNNSRGVVIVMCIQMTWKEVSKFICQLIYIRNYISIGASQYSQKYLKNPIDKIKFSR